MSISPHSSKVLLAILLSVVGPLPLRSVVAQSLDVPTSIVSAAAPASTNSSNSLSAIPDCTRSCLTKATLSLPCEATDTQCLCAHSQQIHDRTLTCLADSTCSESDITLTTNAYHNLCVSLGYPLSSTGTGATTPSSSLPLASNGAASATQSSSSSSSTTAENSSKSNSNTKIYIIAGVAVGVGLILIATITACFCLVTRRRKKQLEQEANEKAVSPPTPPPMTSSSATLTPKIHPSSSVYSPNTIKFPSTILGADDKSTVLAMHNRSSNNSPVSPRRQQQQWERFPTPPPQKPNAPTKPSFTDRPREYSPRSRYHQQPQQHHNRPSDRQHPGQSSRRGPPPPPMMTMKPKSNKSRHISQISSVSQKPKPNPGVRDIEISTPPIGTRIRSQAIILDEDAFSDYTSVTEDSEDEKRQESYRSARSTGSTGSMTKAGTGAAAAAIAAAVGKAHGAPTSDRKGSDGSTSSVKSQRTLTDPSRQANPPTATTATHKPPPSSYLQNHHPKKSSNTLATTGTNKPLAQIPQLSPGLAKFDFGLFPSTSTAAPAQSHNTTRTPGISAPTTPGQTRPGSPASPVSSLGGNGSRRVSGYEGYGAGEVGNGHCENGFELDYAERQGERRSRDFV